MEVTRAAGGIFELATKIAHIHLQRTSYISRCQAVSARCSCHELLGRHRHGFCDGGWCRGRGFRIALVHEIEPPFRWCPCINLRKHCADVLDLVVVYFHSEVAFSNWLTSATLAHHAQAIVYFLFKCAQCFLPSCFRSDASNFDREAGTVSATLDYATLVVSYRKVGHVLSYC